MKTDLMVSIGSFLAAEVLVLTGFTADGQESPSPQARIVYTLTDGSRLTDECPVCDRVPIVLPLRGTFDMELVHQDPLFSTYAIGNIALAASGNGFSYKVTGAGSYVFGGELAWLQDCFLDVEISDGASVMSCKLTNAVRSITRPWPMVQVTLDQTNGTITKQYRLELNAAPFREIWVSTAKGFTAGAWNPPTNAISSGDLLSSAGRIVKKNSDLTGNLGVQPPTPDLGLKDFDILPGAEIVFSIEQDVFSETLGSLSRGDLLSQRGRIVARNADLIAKYSPQPPLPSDIGLAAVQVTTERGACFSVENGFFSEALGLAIQPGDLLSQDGKLVRSGKELLAKFSPAEPDVDYGLAAVFLWPTNPVSGVGEIWFSTRKAFSDKQGTSYPAGDLLSDQGYVVFRNPELISAFAPEPAADFGLDGLFLVTDVAPLAPAPPLIVSQPTFTPQRDGSLMLSWSGPGKVFQAEKASEVNGPYIPISPIVPDEIFIDSGILSKAAGLYRVRQW